MPKFKVESKSNLSQSEAFEKMKTLLADDPDLRKLDSKIEIKTNDAGHTAQVKGSKFSADVKVAATSPGSHVTIEVDLPLMLLPAKGMVQATLEKKLSKILA